MPGLIGRNIRSGYTKTVHIYTHTEKMYIGIIRHERPRMHTRIYTIASVSSKWGEEEGGCGIASVSSLRG